jgi:hypothetical protein
MNFDDRITVSPALILICLWVGGHARQGRHGFSLAAGGDDHDLLVRIFPDLADGNFHAGGMRRYPSLPGDAR